MDDPRCPVCKVLPRDPPTLGLDEQHFEYHLGNELELGSDSDKIPSDWRELWQKPRSCSLYRLVKDLVNVWSGKGNGQAIDSYSSICGRNYLVVCTDKDVWGLLPGRSEAVVYPDPLSAPTRARIRKWVDKCDNDHQGCQGEQSPQLPTRILDIGSSGSSQIVKLMESQGQRGKYIALSHCWGESQPFVTTPASLSDMKMGFLPEKAPPTFRDTILIARELGIKYLRIDSLCIIQGDEVDWQIESSRMSSVYRDAYLTIAASNAKADSDGFLKPRLKMHYSLKVVSPCGKSVQVYILSQSASLPTSYSHEQPLNWRGWTSQEAYLSRRQIKFHGTKILWDCQNSTWDEYHQDRDQYQHRTHCQYWPQYETIYIR